MLRFSRATRALARSRAAALGLLVLAPLHYASGQGDAEVLSNATVIQMVAGKLSKDLITGKISSARPGFDVSSEGIIALNTMKVDQNIIKLMIQVSDNARRSGNAPSTLVGLDEVLTNETIVHMMNAKVPKQLVLQKIQLSRTAFDVSAGGLVSLNTSKVPEDVIKAMILPPVAPPSTAPIPVREPAGAAAPKTDAKTTVKSDTKAATTSTSTKTTTPAKTPPATTTPPKKPPV